MMLNKPLETRVILDEAGWDAIRSDWNTLHAASLQASPPLHFDWMREWWTVYGEVYGSGGLRIVSVWRDTQLIGILPLYLCRRPGWRDSQVLHFLSTGEAESEEICPDYLNLLCMPGMEQECAESMWNAVSQMTWDEVDLVDVPADSPLLRWPQASSRKVKAKRVQRGVCPTSDLRQGFEAYVASLSANARQHARRNLRGAEKAGARFELMSAEQDIERCFDELVRLHQERWTAEGKPGCFAAPRFLQFHRTLSRRWIPAGRAVLARLVHEGRVHAVLYGFINGSKFDFYQSGIAQDDGPFMSPGITAHLMLMRELSQRGIKTYDFLRGSSTYKGRLATGENRLEGIRLWRPSGRLVVHRLGILAGRARRRLGRIHHRGTETQRR